MGLITEEFKSNYERSMMLHSINECEIVSKQLQLEEEHIMQALDIAVSTYSLVESINLNEDDNLDAIMKQVQQIGASLTSKFTSNTPKPTAADLDKIANTEYSPVYVQTRTDISDMKGVNKIKFLLDRVIDWLKRIVLFAINKAKAIFYTIVGRKDDASKMLEKTSVADLKFRLKKLQKIDTGFVRPLTKNGTTRDPKPVQIVEVQPEVIAQNHSIIGAITESLIMNEWTDDTDDNDTTTNNEKSTKSEDSNQQKKDKRDRNMRGSRTPLRAVELDTSSDLYALQQTLHHFFDLFDSAFGSQGENLFDTADLQLVFNYISETAKMFENGKTNPVIMQSQMNNINSEVVYNNLLRTKTNVDNLSKAYYETYNQIDRINKIITSKQLASLTQFGVNYIFLSQYTYSAMIDLLTYVDQRLTEAQKLQTALNKAQKDYEELCNKIAKMRNMVKGFGYIQISTIYDNAINDLYLSTKYMTQITTLRLNTLMKYIQELQSVRLTIANLNALGQAQRGNMKMNVSYAY